MRILILGMTENPGGIESFIIAYYKELYKLGCKIDFLCATNNTIAYEEFFKEQKSIIYKITPKRESFSLYKKELRLFFKKNAKLYDVIWVNLCNLVNIDYIRYAKKYGIKVRIIHSHNSQPMDKSLIRLFLHYWNRNRIKNLANEFWACSKLAAEWFYGKAPCFDYKIINNAIDIQKFNFTVEGRCKIRKEFAIENNFVIGNVGRLHFQKNQQFILEIFEKYHRKNKRSKLLLVGQGPDLHALEQKAIKLGIYDDVIFAGVRSDIQDCLSAMDLFLFPSVFEGLSISVLEAQVSGIPILASENVIPEELAINSNFNFMSLSNTADVWADRLKAISDNWYRCNYEDIYKNMTAAGYNIKFEASKLLSYLDSRV